MGLKSDLVILESHLTVNMSTKCLILGQLQNIDVIKSRPLSQYSFRFSTILAIIIVRRSDIFIADSEVRIGPADITTSCMAFGSVRLRGHCTNSMIWFIKILNHALRDVSFKMIRFQRVSSGIVVGELRTFSCLGIVIQGVTNQHFRSLRPDASRLLMLIGLGYGRRANTFVGN